MRPPLPIQGRLKSFTLHTTQQDVNIEISSTAGVGDAQQPQCSGPSARLRSQDVDDNDDDDFMDLPNRRPIIKKQRINQNVPANARRQGTLKETAAPSNATGVKHDKIGVKYPHAPTVRCAPSIFNSIVDLLTMTQRARVSNMNFGGLLQIAAEKLESRELLKFLYDGLDPDTMVLNVGRGRGIPVTPFAIKQAFGLPDSGEDLPRGSNSQACKAMSDFKALIGLQESEDLQTSYMLQILKDDIEHETGLFDDDLSIRFFFILACNKLLFPSSENKIRAKDVYLTRDLSRLPRMNWCKAVFEELRDSARTWQLERLLKSSPSMNGCAIFLIIIYLDSLSCKHQIEHTNTPRAKYFHQDLIKKIIAADKIRDGQGKVTFGKLPLKDIKNACYYTSQQTIPDIPAFVRPMSAVQFPSIKLELGGLVEKIVTGTRRAQAMHALVSFDSKSKKATSYIQMGEKMLQDAHHQVILKVKKIFEDEVQCKNTEYICPQPTNLSAGQEDVNHNGDNTLPVHTSETMENPVAFDPQNVAGKTLPSMEAAASLPTDGGGNVDSEKGVQHGGSPACSQDRTQLASDHVVPPMEDISYTGPCAAPDASTEHLSFVIDLIDASITRTDLPQDAITDSVASKGATISDNVDQVPSELPEHGDVMVTESQPDELMVTNEPIYPKPQRLTKRPAMYVSPFKGDPRRVQVSLSKAEAVWRKFRPGLKNLSDAFIVTGTRQFTGTEMLDLFHHGEMLSGKFMSYFVQCMSHDESIQMADGAGYRVFLSQQLGVRGHTKATSVLHKLANNIYTLTSFHMFTQEYVNIEDNDEFSQWESHHALTVLEHDIKDVDPTKVKLFLLPILENDHFSVYCINFIHDRIDILDSSPQDHRHYHGALGDRIIPRLNLLFQDATDYTIKQFTRFKRPIIEVPTQLHDNDSGFFAIKFMELWNGESFHTPILSENLNMYKSQLLFYGIYHPINEIMKLPAGLEANRPRL